MLDKVHTGLSAKLLWLTILFVMIAEILIFVPSVANFRVNWLKERIASAQVASLALEVAPGGRLPSNLQVELLRSARVQAVALKRNNRRVLLLQDDMPYVIDEHFDLRTASPFRLILDALQVFFQNENRFIRVVAEPNFKAGESIEVFLKEAPLRDAMVGFAANILGLSIVISVFTAGLVYLALNGLFVRPISRVTRNMMRFRQNPENPGNIIQPSGRKDEIGVAEEQLATMQKQIASSLQQKTRLAALGLAVSKISHDLRNMLANAQLISDRFEAIDNPTVQRFAPKLIGSLDRAIRLCTETLKFGSAQEASPSRTEFYVAPLLDDVAEGLGLSIEQPDGNRFIRFGGREIRWEVDVDDALIVRADRDQLYRVLSNLCRNALQVLAALDHDYPHKRLCVAAREEGTALIATIRDTGPGLPAKARENLFEAFKGAVREGGTGLGLAISAELVRGHGGDISLLESETGATFQITIPDAIVGVRTGTKMQPVG